MNLEEGRCRVEIYDVDVVGSFRICANCSMVVGFFGRRRRRILFRQNRDCKCV